MARTGGFSVDRLALKTIKQPHLPIDCWILDMVAGYVLEGVEVNGTPQRRSQRGTRAYLDDAQWPAVRRRLAPLPKKPAFAPLTDEQIRQGVAPLLESDEIAERVADELFDEAEKLMASRLERIKTAEAKATTLMGTVAISASLVVGGAGLLLDGQKLTGIWRVAAALTVLALLACLLLCGFHASRALLNVRKISRPQMRQALSRTQLGDRNRIRIARAGDLMIRANANLWVADFKLAQLRAADFWYRWALVGFAALGGEVVWFVVWQAR